MTALRAIAGGADRGAVLSSSIVVGSLGLLTLSVTTNAWVCRAPSVYEPPAAQ